MEHYTYLFLVKSRPYLSPTKCSSHLYFSLSGGELCLSFSGGGLYLSLSGGDLYDGMKDFQPMCRDRESFSSVGNLPHGENNSFRTRRFSIRSFNMMRLLLERSHGGRLSNFTAQFGEHFFTTLFLVHICNLSNISCIAIVGTRNGDRYHK